MKLIKNIEIRHFRSIYSSDLNNLEDFNVFAGTNDSGKSNILKALNLFFNGKTSFFDDFKFEKDFSKLALLKVREKKKGRQFISIRIYFNEDSIDGRNDLKKLAKLNGGLWIERKWWRFNETTYEQNIPDYLQKASQGIKRSFSVFLDTIKFVYIPAFKNEEVFSYVLRLAGDTEGVFLDKKAKDNLDSKISETTQQLSKDFSDITKITTKISLPITLESFWSGLQISSDFEGILDQKIITRGKIEDYFIDFTSRGEGIKSIFIPVILGWLAKFTTNRYWIWGIDEPENSIEIIRAVEIFNKFIEYSKETQIFASSHSPVFIFPKIDSKNLTVYIASQNNSGDTKFELIRDREKNLLEEEHFKKLQEKFGVEYSSFLKFKMNTQLIFNLKKMRLKKLKNY